MRTMLLATATVLIAASCSSSTPAAESVPPPTDQLGDPSTIPAVRRDLTDVALADVNFDTFGQGPLTLADATDQDAAALLDVIPPIDRPPYVSAGEDPWLESADVVLGYVSESGQAYAYPHKILSSHEIVNDTIDGVPLLASYCPLCNSGVVFDRRPVDPRHDAPLSFSNTSALYDNDLVMVDRETGTYWWQVPGRAIVGPLVGAELTVLPSHIATWERWRALHPDTLVLSRDLGFGRDYRRDRFLGYAERVDAGQFPFPVNEAARNDDRLSAATQVIGVDRDGQARAVALGGVGVAEFELAGAQVVVLVDGEAGAAFRPVAGDQPVALTVDNGMFVDAETGTVFDLAGRATSGPLAGSMLDPVPSRSTFWFAYVAAQPDVVVVALSP